MAGTSDTPVTFNVFEVELHDALTHLYTPLYQPAAVIRRVLNLPAAQESVALHQRIVQAIEAMKPACDIPATARAWRMYELLASRYVQNISHKQTALQLGISPRHLSREQAQAVHLLAQQLWRQSQTPASTGPDAVQEVALPSGQPGAEAKRTAFRDQVRQELIALQQSAPGLIADVNQVMQSLAALGAGLTASAAIQLTVHPTPSPLLALIHPTVLRQLLITAVEKVAQQLAVGEIMLAALQDGQGVTITVSGRPAQSTVLPQSDFVHEILVMLGSALKVQREDDQLAFVLHLPSVTKVTVLVVDDNSDLVHFYQRYVEGTRYHLVHVREGQAVFPTIAEVTPDLIVLDVMLPDIDGWQLLIDLRRHPLTQQTPIVVCSVVRREQLALSLGATAYLPKPVHRQAFIQMLEQASTAHGKGPANSAAVAQR